MTFEELLNKLSNLTFEEIVTEYNDQLYEGDGIPVECIENEVYDDQDLYDFLEELGAEIINYGVNYVLIKTNDEKYFEVPSEDRENRFDDELPDETILFFDIDKICDVTESYAK